MRSDEELDGLAGWTGRLNGLDGLKRSQNCSRKGVDSSAEYKEGGLDDGATHKMLWRTIVRLSMVRGMTGLR